MERFADIIDAFGIGTLGKALGVDESHIRAMKTRDSIPPVYWPAVIEAATGHGIEGVTWEFLGRLRAKRFPRDAVTQPEGATA